MNLFYVCADNSVIWESSKFWLSEELEGAFLIMKTRVLTSPFRLLNVRSR